MLAEMKAHQRRDVMLLIDEILITIDSASPAADKWKSARRFVQLIEGKKYAPIAGVPAGATHGEPVRVAANDNDIGTITGFQPVMRMGLARL